MTTSPSLYRGFRYPAKVIQHPVWLNRCFSLSRRDVETILAARGVMVSDEGMRGWGLRFCWLLATALKQCWWNSGNTWQIDKVFLRIRGKVHPLWRAMDQHGNVLDFLVESRRGAIAQRSRGRMSGKLTETAKRFLHKLLRGLQYVPQVIVTNKLRSGAVARREILPGVEHRKSRHLNSRSEVSHYSTRRRERQMQRLQIQRSKSAHHAQRFLFTHNHVQLRRHRLTAYEHCAASDAAFCAWRQVVGVTAA